MTYHLCFWCFFFFSSWDIELANVHDTNESRRLLGASGSERGLD